MLSIRFYLYGLAQERYDIWQQEQSRIDDNWQEWAMSHTNILGSYWVTPNELNATKIVFDGQNLPVQIDKVLEFDSDEFEYEHYFEDLFYSLGVSFNTLPDTANVVITIYSSSEAYSYLDDIIYSVCRRCQLNKRYTIDHKITSNVQVEKIIELIDNQQHDVQLVIMNNLLSKGSAFLAGLLLIDEQFYPEIDKSMIESNLLRPMITQDISTSIKQMVEMQPAVSDVTQLWCANLDKEQEVEIAKQLAEHDISPKSINFLDSIAGKQTDLAYWSLLALGNQLVKHTEQDILIATRSQGKYLFSVLTSNNLGQSHDK